MELVVFEDFMVRTLGGRPNQMDLAPYFGYPFSCACGTSHSFDPSSAQVLRELAGMRLVITCPDTASLTCVKVKGLIRFKGFESLFGTQRLEHRREADYAVVPPEQAEELIRFAQDRISHSDQIVCKFWANDLGLAESPIQARHGIATIVAAIVTSRKVISADARMEVASEYLSDSQFASFLREPDVREGLRDLVADARSAANSGDLKSLSYLLQTFLLMPVGDPACLSPVQAKALLSCIESIGSHAITMSLLAP